MKKITLLILILLPVLLLSQTQTENYIKTTTYKVESTTVITNPTPLQADQNITYFDGLNRPVQQIAHQQSGTGKDIVTHIEYDAMGRQEKNYLPYVPSTAASLNYKTSALTDLGTFYNTAKYENTLNPYSQKEFETSPHNRILKQASPGTDWSLNKNSNADHTIKFEYGTNTSREVKLFSVHLNYVNGVSEPQLRYGQNGDAYLNPTIQTFNITVLTPEGAYSFYCDENVYILDAAEEAGVDLPYSDRKGASTSSLGLLVSGCIDNSDQSYLPSSNLDKGLFTYDVAYPRSDVIFFSHMEEEFSDYNSTTLITYHGYTGVSANRNCGDPKYALSYYNENELYKTVTKNENWQPNLKDNTTEEFKNKQGQVVLKRTYNNVEIFDTYYVYDDYGNLTYVIPPKANTKSFFISTTDLDGLCYQYKYDKRNRLVEKKLPGKEWEYIVYDKLDRPVLTQDGNLRTANKWLFTKYDQFSRPVYTGEYVNNIQTSRDAVQVLANANNTLFENKQASPNINADNANYSNNAFPNTGISLFTINYYDNYADINLDGGTAVVSYGVTPVTNAKGLSTCSKVRILGTSLWTTNVIYYDEKGRVVYIYSNNNFLSNVNTTKSKLDFTGKILETTSTHQKGTADVITTIDTFTYDHAGRLLSQKQKINSKAQETIAVNTYDDLGELITKAVGGTGSSLQTINYSYNIRGWLKNINDINNIGTDLFAFQIKYNDIADVSKKLYNGNISQTLWKTANTDSSLKSYTYTYDPLNRLTSAGDNLNKFNERLSYDKNGNITHLIRWGEIVGGSTVPDINVASHFGIMDNLNYVYDSGNQLQIVTDSGSDTYGFKDDLTGPAYDTTTDYTYDANGNMKTDTNKGITNIDYNYLNLPVKITFATGSIDYTYDAVGTKIEKKVTETSKPDFYTQYAGSYIYEKSGNNPDVLKFFSQPEGYVSYNSGTFDYIYQYKDHLGNVRLSYDKNLVIQEENNYYPFGLKHKGYNNVNNITTGSSSAQKYKYNGKELQEELGLNMTGMDWRQYDNVLGRFNCIDALAEMNYSISPYSFSNNNPIYWSDPTGLISQALYNSLWNNSARNGITTWTNDGGGTFSNGSGMVDSETGEYTGFDSLKEVTITARKTSGSTSRFEGNLGGLAQSKAYSYGKFYKKWRSDFFTKQLDDTQEYLDVLGTADPTGVVDGVNALGYLVRGQNANAAIAAVAIIPYIGDAAKGSKIVSKSDILINSTSQLQKKFKHAPDFGVIGTPTKENLKSFSSALNQHINNPIVRVINGTYQGRSVIHYLDPASGLNVMSKTDGTFISGWRLNQAQLNNVLNRSSL